MPRTLSLARVLLTTVVLCAGGSGVAYATAELTAAPVVTGVAIAPGTVDTGAGAATVVVYAHLSSPSAVASAAVRLGDASAPLSRTGGTAYDGEWSGVATVPAGTAHGPLAAYVDGADAVGNTTTTTADGAVVVADTAPAAPSSVSAALGTDPGTLRVDWTPPPANGGSAVGSYAVSAEPVTGALPVVETAAADATSLTLTGLADATRYVVRVAATNPAGNGPAAIADVSLASPTTPSAPASLLATPDAGTLHVHWVAPVSDGGDPVTGYEVRAVSPADDVPPVTVPADATSATMPALANGRTYDVTVTALNALGTGIAATTRAVPRTVPDAPAIGTATAGDASAVVRWAAPAHDGGAPVAAYVVTAHPSGTVRVVPAAATSVAMSSLANGVAATFTVAAVNAAGAGVASLPSKAVTPRIPSRFAVLAQPAGAVTYPTASVVRAAVRTPSGTGIPGVSVELLARIVPKTTWRRVASGTTDSNGAVTLRATLPARAALKLHHAPSAVAPTDLSVRSVAIRPRITAGVSTTHLALGTVLTVHGSVAPSHAIGSRLYLQRYVSARWQTVAAGAMVSRTAYRIGWRPTSAGAWYLRVVKAADADHAQGTSSTWREYAVDTVASTARAIRANRRITLDTVHASGTVDAATAAANMSELASGHPARRSSYGTAPGGSTPVSVRVLQALRAMGVRGTITVSEVAGGSHSAGSAHYSGRALDVRVVNGVHVARGTSYGWVVDTCRAYGATHVYHPSYDPYGGHGGHVHCDWS